MTLYVAIEKLIKYNKSLVCDAHYAPLRVRATAQPLCLRNMKELDDILNGRDVKKLDSFLCDYPDYINKDLTWGNTLLSALVEGDNYEMVKLLLEKGADPNKLFVKRSPIRTEEKIKSTAICSVKSKEVLDLLVGYGANINQSGVDINAVENCISCCRVELAKELLNKKCFPRQKYILARKKWFLEELEFRNKDDKTEKVQERIKDLKNTLSLIEYIEDNKLYS